MTRRYWPAFVVLAVLLAAVARWGPHETGPDRPLEASTTAEPAAPVAMAARTGPGPYTAAETAVRAPRDPLAGFHGRYQCRFATAGRQTPCCPGAIETLALFWQGADLAVADYIVGRESGCDEGVVNSSGCVGWFQLCGWRCDGSCRDGYANAEKARDLFDRYGWCSTASWYLRGDPVTGRNC